MTFSRTITTTVTVPINTAYFSEFLRLKCAADILPFFRKTKAKEITESFSAFRAARKTLKEKTLGRSDVTVLIPGDGTRPRTGAVFAFRSNWKILSVDPLMRDEADGVKRLTTYKMKIEDFPVQDCEGGIGIVVAVHSHAQLDAAVPKLKNWARLVIISIPCCVPQFLTVNGEKIEPKVKYLDVGIFSPKNEVLIWDIKPFEKSADSGIMEITKER